MMLNSQLDPIRDSVEGGESYLAQLDVWWNALPWHTQAGIILALFTIVFVCLLVALGGKK